MTVRDSVQEYIADRLLAFYVGVAVGSVIGGAVGAALMLWWT